MPDVKTYDPPRELAGGAKRLASEIVPPDVERLRALLRARAEATGFDVALVDVALAPPAPASHPDQTVRILVCFPTGDEVKLAEVVMEAFAEAIAAPKAIAALVERECRAWRSRKDVDESEAQAVEVLGEVISSLIEAGEWRKVAREDAGPLFSGGS